VKLPVKHFEKGVDILSDMISSPLFSKKTLEKERQVILKEINIFNDESRYYQWILFEQNLFSNHPARHPVYGTRKDVAGVSREAMLSYYHKHYCGENIIISIVGDISRARQMIERYFSSIPRGKRFSKTFSSSPLSRSKMVREKRILNNSYMVLGFPSVSRLHPDSYVLDIIQAILGRGQSGRIFDEIRNKRGLAYEVGVNHTPATDYGYFAIYLSADKAMFPLIKKLINKELSALSSVSKEAIWDALTYTEGRHILENEDTHHRADELAFWELMGDLNLSSAYLARLKTVTPSAIKRVSEKYFTRSVTAVVEQK
jgi:predicted Zn-dependent peptidase